MEASSTMFWVFGMTRPGIEPQYPEPLTDTLTIKPDLALNNPQGLAYDKNLPTNQLIYLSIYLSQSMDLVTSHTKCDHW